MEVKRVLRESIVLPYMTYATKTSTQNRSKAMKWATLRAAGVRYSMAVNAKGTNCLVAENTLWKKWEFIIHVTGENAMNSVYEGFKDRVTWKLCNKMTSIIKCTWKLKLFKYHINSLLNISVNNEWASMCNLNLYLNICKIYHFNYCTNKIQLL